MVASPAPTACTLICDDVYHVSARTALLISVAFKHCVLRGHSRKRYGSTTESRKLLTHTKRNVRVHFACVYGTFVPLPGLLPRVIFSSFNCIFVGEGEGLGTRLNELYYQVNMSVCITYSKYVLIICVIQLINLFP